MPPAHENLQIFSLIKLSFIFLPCVLAAAVKLENEEEMICIPNATFHIDCNRCKCSPTGMSIDCTDWSCSTLQIPHDLLLNITLDCQPGNIFIAENLKCLCSSDGSNALCSSARYELARNLLPADGGSIGSLTNGRACAPGLVFKNERCDTCICDELGPACTRIGCVGDRRADGCARKRGWSNYAVDYKQELCVPFSEFSIDCNQCVCSSDGHSFSCDSYPCLGVEMRHDQLLNMTFLCEPSSRFLYNRHECSCSASGRFARCSLARYDKAEEYRQSGLQIYEIAEFPELCTPGVVFKDLCNICICGKDERAACTRLDCDFAGRYEEEPADARIVRREEIWKQRKKNSRFCKRNPANEYCRYLHKL